MVRFCPSDIELEFVICQEAGENVNSMPHRTVHKKYKQTNYDTLLLTPNTDLKWTISLSRLNPFIDEGDVEMALWVPNDGVIDASNLVQAYVKGATMGGTKYVEGVSVKKVETDGDRVAGMVGNSCVL